MNNAFVFFQPRLLSMKALPVHSPTLKMYFALSKLMTTVGSVSAVVVESTDADQIMSLLAYRRERYEPKVAEGVRMGQVLAHNSLAATLNEC